MIINPRYSGWHRGQEAPLCIRVIIPPYQPLHLLPTLLYPQAPHLRPPDTAVHLPRTKPLQGTWYMPLSFHVHSSVSPRGPLYEGHRSWLSWCIDTICGDRNCKKVINSKLIQNRIQTAQKLHSFSFFLLLINRCSWMSCGINIEGLPWHWLAPLAAACYSGGKPAGLWNDKWITLQ